MQRIRTKKQRRRVNKWVYISIAVVLILIACFLLYLRSADKPVRAAQKEALDRIDGYVTIKDVSRFYLYNGPKEDYSVLVGKNKSNKRIIVWVPKKKTGKVFVKYAADGISEKRARSIIRSEKNPEKILHVKLGMENEKAIWEVTYLTGNGNLNYVNLSFEDGKVLRSIENL